MFSWKNKFFHYFVEKKVYLLELYKLPSCRLVLDLLLLCMLGNLHTLSANFSRNYLFINKFQKYRVSNSLDLDQAVQKVGPDLDPDSLQRLLGGH